MTIPALTTADREEAYRIDFPQRDLSIVNVTMIINNRVCLEPFVDLHNEKEIPSSSYHLNGVDDNDEVEKDIEPTLCTRAPGVDLEEDGEMYTSEVDVRERERDTETPTDIIT